ncbi:MAG: hypothetical protein R3E01_16575 [Pirellulaceae bacterium]|nr:hypothetical protein [Planctomycetales bacterium]
MSRNWGGPWSAVLASKLRLWQKKRGNRRTGSPIVARVGETVFFAALFLLSATILVAAITFRLLPSLKPRTWTQGQSFWLLVFALGSLAILSATRLIYRLLVHRTSAERRKALARRASELDPRADRGPALRDYPTIPQNANLVNSPGITLAYRLPIASSPIVRTWISAVAAMILSGLTAVVAVVVYQQFQQEGSISWLMLLLVLPMLVATIWCVKDFFYCLVLFNSVGPTQVEVSDLPLIPGQRYAVFLSQAGQVNVVALTMKLVCQEEVTYREGTDVRTERREVAERTVLECRDFTIKAGIPFEYQAEFFLPDEAMHSFKAPNNAIRWQLVVTGKYRKWPPTQRVFPLIVIPLMGQVNTPDSGESAGKGGFTWNP